jgi:hypothetical protein
MWVLLLILSTHLPDKSCSSTGRCNTIKAADPTILPLKNRSVRLYSIRPSQGGVPFESTFANGFKLLSPKQVDFELVLRRPIKTARITGSAETLRGT